MDFEAALKQYEDKFGMVTSRLEVEWFYTIGQLHLSQKRNKELEGLSK